MSSLGAQRGARLGTILQIWGRSSNLFGCATSVHAIDVKRRRSCASTADKRGWKFRLGAARVEGRPNRIFSDRRRKGPAWRHESDGFYRPVWSAFEAGLACFHMRSVERHRAHGLDARVIEIAKPRERTNLEHIKSAFWSQNIITNMCDGPRHEQCQAEESCGD